MRFTLNGRSRRLDVHPLKRLLDVLREDCGLTGTKEGCGEGECGACTVLLDDEPINACLLLALHADGRRVTTARGLGLDSVAAGLGLPLQEAFVAHGAVQCGFCIPGMLVTATHFLRTNRNPSREQIRVA